MKLVTFASGSSGNCALVRDGDSCVLIDAGISLRRIRAGLARQGLTFDDVGGILITHEHSDHVAGLPMVVKYQRTPVYAPRTVANHLLRAVPDLEDCLTFVKKDEPFSVKDFRITAFSTPHDTDESVGYLLEGSGRLGFCTDTGTVTETMLERLSGCGAALIEANHDVDMLRWGAYPVVLKRRILSEHGHLSNADCGTLACALAESGTRRIALGHLSRENNTPRLARDTVRAALDGAGYAAVELFVAPADGDMELEIEPCCASN